MFFSILVDICSVLVYLCFGFIWVSELVGLVFKIEKEFGELTEIRSELKQLHSEALCKSKIKGVVSYPLTAEKCEEMVIKIWFFMVVLGIYEVKSTMRWVLGMLLLEAFCKSTWKCFFLVPNKCFCAFQTMINDT